MNNFRYLSIYYNIARRIQNPFSSEVPVRVGPGAPNFPVLQSENRKVLCSGVSVELKGAVKPESASRSMKTSKA